mgnify:CR=1 FL=1
MSNGRRSRVVEAGISLLMLVLGFAAVLLVLQGPQSGLRLAGSRPSASPPTPVQPGSAGLGDPYYPAAGGSGYEVERYQVKIDYEPSSGQLVGAATVTLVTLQQLTQLHLDLMLTATAVSLDGVELVFHQDGDDLQVKLPAAAGKSVAAGERISLIIRYQGLPHEVRFPKPTVYRQEDELLICGEPQSASAWFPVNDHPRDPASYEITVSVPAGYEAISIGVLASHQADPRRPGWDQWRWVSESPTPTYTAMLAIGQYTVRQAEVTVAGRPTTAVYAVSERAPRPAQAMTWLEQTPRAIETVELHLGRYPVSGVGGVVPGVNPVWGGMEAAGRPVYHPLVVGRDSVLLHEVTHMWFGNTVTLNEWRSIFLNEALTSYLEWVTAAEWGSEPDPQRRFDASYAAQRGDFWKQRLSDPGSGDLLFARVYDRGPMAVHALRVRMGDEAFFRFLRQWASQQGPRRLDQWRAAAQVASPVDVSQVLATWLDGTSRPARTPENGFVR